MDEWTSGPGGYGGEQQRRRSRNLYSRAPAGIAARAFPPETLRSQQKTPGGLRSDQAQRDAAWPGQPRRRVAPCPAGGVLRRPPLSGCRAGPGGASQHRGCLPLGLLVAIWRRRPHRTSPRIYVSERGSRRGRADTPAPCLPLRIFSAFHFGLHARGTARGRRWRADTSARARGAPHLRAALARCSAFRPPPGQRKNGFTSDGRPRTERVRAACRATRRVRRRP